MTSQRGGSSPPGHSPPHLPVVAAQGQVSSRSHQTRSAGATQTQVSISAVGGQRWDDGLGHGNHLCPVQLRVASPMFTASKCGGSHAHHVQGWLVPCSPRPRVDGPTPPCPRVTSPMLTMSKGKRSHPPVSKGGHSQAYHIQGWPVPRPCPRVDGPTLTMSKCGHSHAHRV